jgi:glucan phosphorylase
MAETAETAPARAQGTSDPGPGVAYFSMEVYLDSGMPTYGGGLGVLAGDTIRSAADLKVPMVAITLLHRRGYSIRGSIRWAGRPRSRSTGSPAISSASFPRGSP